MFQLSQRSGEWVETILHAFDGFDGGAPGGNLIWVRSSLVGTANSGGILGWGVVFEITQTTHGIREIVLYNFQGGQDGVSPQPGLVVDNAVHLYGTTLGGGGSPACPEGPGCGTVFELSPPQPGGQWTETVLHSFGGGTDGIAPAGAVLLGNAWLVGVTFEGGGSQECVTGGIDGCGQAFAVHK